MSLYTYVPAYDKLSSIYLNDYLTASTSFLNLLKSYNSSSWYIPSIRSRYIYTYNPTTYRISYKSEYIPIGCWNPSTYKWTWPWSSYYNKKLLETYVDLDDMRALRTYIGGLSSNLISSDVLTLTSMDYSKVTNLISAMAMSALNGRSVHALGYDNGNVVYAVLRNIEKSSSSVPTSIQKQMKKRKKKSTRRKKSTPRKSTRRKSTPRKSTRKKKSTRRKSR